MKNTFENVRFTREILLEKEINNVLFLTAPIHSKRVEMILEKNVKDINFVMGKTTENYYDKFSWGMSYKKIKAVSYEYLAVFIIFLGGGCKFTSQQIT